MPYAIIRHAKIKTLGNLAASAQHTLELLRDAGLEHARNMVDRRNALIRNDEILQRQPAS